MARGASPPWSAGGFDAALLLSSGVRLARGGGHARAYCRNGVAPRFAACAQPTPAHPRGTAIEEPLACCWVGLGIGVGAVVVLSLVSLFFPWFPRLTPPGRVMAPPAYSCCGLRRARGASPPWSAGGFDAALVSSSVAVGGKNSTATDSHRIAIGSHRNYFSFARGCAGKKNLVIVCHSFL